MVEEIIKKDFAENISLRGRSFKGTVIRKFPKRVVIEFERTIYVKKYERYSKRKTKLHARLPESMSNDIQVGDYIETDENERLHYPNFSVINLESTTWWWLRPLLIELTNYKEQQCLATNGKKEP